LTTVSSMNVAQHTKDSDGQILTWEIQVRSQSGKVRWIEPLNAVFLATSKDGRQRSYITIGIELEWPEQSAAPTP
jgi:hypothetical protein